jgi:hypothetical protein
MTDTIMIYGLRRLTTYYTKLKMYAMQYSTLLASQVHQRSLTKP